MYAPRKAVMRTKKGLMCVKPTGLSSTLDKLNKHLPVLSSSSFSPTVTSSSILIIIGWTFCAPPQTEGPSGSSEARVGGLKPLLPVGAG